MNRLERLLRWDSPAFLANLAEAGIDMATMTWQDMPPLTWSNLWYIGERHSAIMIADGDRYLWVSIVLSHRGTQLAFRQPTFDASGCEFTPWCTCNCRCTDYEICRCCSSDCDQDCAECDYGTYWCMTHETVHRFST